MNSRPIVAASTLPLPRLEVGPEGVDLNAIERDLSVVLSCGTSVVDITDTWLPVSELSGDDIQGITTVLQRRGITVCGVSVVRRSIIDPDAASENLQHTRNVIALADAVGANVVSIGFHESLPPMAAHVPFWAIEGSLPDRDDPVPIVRELAVEADRVDIALALELYEGGPLGSGRQAVEMVERIGAANVGINLDVGNLYRSPMSSAETWWQCVQICLPVTNFWHVKNYQRVHEYPTGRHMGSVGASLPDGDIDYRRCITAARSAGYGGPISVEHYGGDGIAVQRAGVEYLRELLSGLELDDVRAEEIDATNHR